ncbi:hypothetical protein [Aurantimonas sp. HBX-1]|uniref:hypothetical protein n=1 Tax=Aurantimonas sp. HBX-1 TaxID=2906072 RepID=UPI001F44459D|nr:hypothetical protein [Aurantimonas sp. HBX-1]UIJ70383.1 hypothetical protein LXB15_11420 [Aurantimonas sp. HBX-1]
MSVAHRTISATSPRSQIHSRAGVRGGADADRTAPAEATYRTPRKGSFSTALPES